MMMMCACLQAHSNAAGIRGRNARACTTTYSSFAAIVSCAGTRPLHYGGLTLWSPLPFAEIKKHPVGCFLLLEDCSLSAGSNQLLLAVPPFRSSPNVAVTKTSATGPIVNVGSFR